MVINTLIHLEKNIEYPVFISWVKRMCYLHDRMRSCVQKGKFVAKDLDLDKM